MTIKLFCFCFQPVKTDNKNLENFFPSARQLTEDHSSTKHEDVIFSEVDSAGIIFNYTLLYAIYENFLIGVEILIYYDVTGNYSYFAIFPQVQAHFSMEVQVGPGLVFTKDKIIPKFAHRLIVETLPNNRE